jgi:hypothetical protein
MNAAGSPGAHRQGCDALGGYGNGIGPCTCGSVAEVAELPTVAWLYHDGPTLREIPSEMLGSTLLSFERRDWCRNEAALTYRDEAQSTVDRLTSELALAHESRENAERASIQKIGALTAELQEQARCNGMGSEREAALLAKVDELTRRLHAAAAGGRTEP